MKALSIQEPWPWAIFNGKPVENRTWKTDYRGLFLIHAGKIEDKDGRDWISKTFNLVIPDSLPMGGIVGIANLTHCVTPSEFKDQKHPNMRWVFGPYCFVLADQKPLPFMPCKGKLSFFEVEYLMECCSCSWKGDIAKTIHPKHDYSIFLCPECHETTEPNPNKEKP